MKECTNKECASMLEDGDAHCRFCGNKQLKPKVIKKVKRGLFGKRKEEPPIDVELIEADQFEDVKTILPKLAKKPDNKSVGEQLTRMENKIDITHNKIDVIHSNYRWLLVNVKNWVDGHGQTKEPEEPEEVEETQE